MIGLFRGEVRIEPYTDDWKVEYEKEKIELARLFDKVAIEIEHIGSTSIEGLSAKPIIDIAIAVNKLSDFDEVREKVLLTGNYTLKEEADDEILIRREKDNFVTSFIHVMEIDSSRYKDSIVFRNYLRKHEDVKIEYENLKRELSIKYKDDRPSYTKNKSEFISNILEIAYKEI